MFPVPDPDLVGRGAVQFSEGVDGVSLTNNVLHSVALAFPVMAGALMRARCIAFVRSTALKGVSKVAHEEIKLSWREVGRQDIIIRTARAVSCSSAKGTCK